MPEPLLSVPRASLTPAMRQYIDVKEANPDAIIFFRMGDFYEMFFEDARVASSVLGIALTSRDKEKRIPMCGIPYHAASGYIARLIKEGMKVAVCEQVEDPKAATGVVRREVTKVVTPGVAFDDELLEPAANNYIASVCIEGRTIGFSYMDASTGEFRATVLSSTDELADELRRIDPLELLVPESQSSAVGSSVASAVKKITNIADYDYAPEVAEKRLTKHYAVASLDGLGLIEIPVGTQAAGALLGYITDTQRATLGHISRVTPYHTHDYLVLDAATRRNLEITRNIRDNGTRGTLLELLDRTNTAIGARMLRAWLAAPLTDPAGINSRLDAVAELADDRALLENLTTALSGIYDLERLITRVTLGTANPRDLVSLKDSLARLPALKGCMEGALSRLLAETAAEIDPVEEAKETIGQGISDDPSHHLRDGGVIRAGYNADLDELREIGSGGKERIAALEAAERERTGINTLKVGYNKVFGYYIEVSKTRSADVPEEYIRKQTLVGAERFITPSLKEYEERVLTAEERARALEATLYAGILERVGREAVRVQRTASLVATLDVLASLATVARAKGYNRPVVDDGPALSIKGGRHPVIEASLPDDFVSNDLELGEEAPQIVVLTGPNMAGKSTYLRQNALVVLMAQIGSFVPAESARVGVVDRIFTRIGASDDISRGQSTFMVEMNETANILNNATDRSLIVLDEIGRGTSTFDGLSIAWSVVEYLHDHAGFKGRAKTLFATHYHELTELSLTKERVKNYNMAVKEHGGSIIFIRKVVPGGCSSSYGIQVARLAGLPDEVITRSREILRNLETGELNASGVPRIAEHTAQDAPQEKAPVGSVLDREAAGTDAPRQLNLLGERDRVAEELARVDLNRTTPMDALTLLARMKEMLEDR